MPYKLSPKLNLERYGRLEGNMDVTDILPSLSKLDGDVDNLEEVLKPLLGNLSEVSSKLPLLDKAKLYVLITYALESMLFCKQLFGHFRQRCYTNQSSSHTTSERG